MMFLSLKDSSYLNKLDWTGTSNDLCYMKGFCSVHPHKSREGEELFEISQQVSTALINNTMIANRTRHTSSQ